jgi:ATP-dependent helicase HrpA
LPDGGFSADATQAAIDGVLLPPTEPVPRDEETFFRRLAERQGAFGMAVREQVQLASDAQALAEERRAALEEASLPSETEGDLAEQIDWLVFPGFARVVPRERLRHYGRYFEAMRLRMERARQNPARDAERMAVVRGFWERYTEAVAKPGLAPEEHRALADIRWAIEELRVSLFAQELRTPAPVSAQRIERMFAEVGR